MHCSGFSRVDWSGLRRRVVDRFESYDPRERPRMEAEFLSREHWIERPPVEGGRALADHLAHRVSRNARDLVSHVHRILLLEALGDREACYGALLDLFIVLEDQGRRLRRRLLTRCRHSLNPDQRRALEDRLTAASRSTGPMPASRFSRLDRSVRGKRLLVRCPRTRGQDLEGPLAVARDLIDSGRIDAARQRLETALLEAPDDGAIETELLAIYRHTRDGEGLARMRRRLPDGPSRRSWDELAAQIERRVGNGS